MDWIAEVERIDRMLHSAGVPAEPRMRALAQIADALAQAKKAQRTRRQLVLEAVQRCHGNVREAANEEGWSYETFYRELRVKKVTKPPVDVTDDPGAYASG